MPDQEGSEKGSETVPRSSTCAASQKQVKLVQKWWPCVGKCDILEGGFSTPA